MSSRIPNSVAVGAAAVGIGVAVGAGLAYLSTRILHSSRVTQEISELHDNIVEMKQNLALIESELGKLYGAVPTSSTLRKENHFSSNNSTTSSRRSKNKKNVSFNNSVARASYCASAAETGSTAGSYITAVEGSLHNGDSSAYDTDYFSPDEGDTTEDDEFFDFVPSDSEETTFTSQNSEWSGGTATELTELLRRVDAQFCSGEEAEILAAHASLLEARHSFPLNAEVLWRLAKSHRNMATLEEKKGNLDMKKHYIFEAYVYAEKSLSINDNSADTHKWYAITSGARGEFLSTRERIESGKVFKKHIDAALAFSPNDATLHHLLGRFCYEISGLTWLERRAASALFGSVPESSYAEALQHFMSAEELHASGWKENRLFIAKCLVKLQRLDSVADWLQRALQLPTATADDMVVDEQLNQMLLKHPTAS
ncbi:regulator of microtubule dynamics protein 1 isoform X2 [Hyalella azteca]|uniref:Regulator of microtubule dynamics protein 1 n=1 Tax=Hyalella azteca TaxID=294128 RepID=A0A979FQZ2_HYAAZ|nr:regulator of microtubule dynamics protein 1 isoform X2 [Hyalella azteca]